MIPAGQGDTKADSPGRQPRPSEPRAGRIDNLAQASILSIQLDFSCIDRTIDKKIERLIGKKIERLIGKKIEKLIDRIIDRIESRAKRDSPNDKD
jgi:hypothetical protein